MKIYSVYEYGGQWEDKYERILGSFISEEKALEFKRKLEKERQIEEVDVKKCRKCQENYDWIDESKQNIEQLIDFFSQEYDCASFEIIEYEDCCNMICKNRTEEDYFFDEFGGYNISSIEINDADNYIITRKG